MKKLTQEQRQRIKELYELGFTDTQVGQEIGCSNKTVSNVLINDYGIRQRKKRPTKPSRVRRACGKVQLDSTAKYCSVCGKKITTEMDDILDLIRTDISLPICEFPVNERDRIMQAIGTVCKYIRKVGEEKQ